VRAAAETHLPANSTTTFCKSIAACTGSNAQHSECAPSALYRTACHAAARCCMALRHLLRYAFRLPTSLSLDFRVNSLSRTLSRLRWNIPAVLERDFIACSLLQTYWITPCFLL